MSYGVPGPVACRPTTFEATANENCDLPLSAEAAQAWISENLMPPYWIETTDSKGYFKKVHHNLGV